MSDKISTQLNPIPMTSCLLQSSLVLLENTNVLPFLLYTCGLETQMEPLMMSTIYFHGELLHNFFSVFIPLIPSFTCLQQIPKLFISETETPLSSHYPIYLHISICEVYWLPFFLGYPKQKLLFAPSIHVYITVSSPFYINSLL